MIDSDLYAEAPVVRARLEVPPEAIDELLEATCLEDPAPGAYQDLLSGRAWVEAYGVDRSRVERSIGAVQAYAKTIGLAVPDAPEWALLPKEDWAESWKKFFSVLHVSPRVTVRPPWEEYVPARSDEVVVVIEPGMSFGTGLHGTTQACLRFLEELAEEPGDPLARSVADFGCGSGILSIAARKLGFASVHGVDYDAAAVRISIENARDNGVPDVTYAPCDVTVDPLPRRDIVVANILAPILVAAAPRIAGAVTETPGSALILSGILTTQYADVRSAYEAQGFREVRSITIGEWTSGRFARG